MTKRLKVTRSLRSIGGAIAVATVVTACGSSSVKPAVITAAPGVTTTTVDPASCGSVGKPITHDATSASKITGVESYRGMSRDHIAPGACVKYPQTPPVGGNHSQTWQGCNFYAGRVLTEQGVHSMEHGAVWITYRPVLASTELDVLKKFSSNDYVLISQWDAALTSPIVASAWGLQLQLPTATDSRLAAFVKAYANGPQTPEPGVPCRDGGSMTI